MKRWTLRTRLVVSILALTTLALVLANVVGIALLQSMLVRRVDEQLTAASTGIGARIQQPMPALPPGGYTAVDVSLERLLTKRVAQVSRIMIYTSSGTLKATLPPTGEPGPVIDRLSYDGPYTVPGTEGPGWRVVATAVPTGDTVVIGTSLADVEQTRTSLIAIAVAVSAAVLVLLGMAADVLVRLGLRPLTRMENTASHIAGGDFARRVPDPDPHTEPGRLGQAMNVMLDRVTHEIAARTASEARMRRFLADASHELRTPLTSVRGFAELHRRGGGDADETMRRIEDEATRMGGLVNDLLTLAQLDEERALERGRVDLLEVAADTIRDARARVPDRQVRLTGLGDTLAPVSLAGDEARLRQVAANLVGNALAHTPSDASVTVRVGRTGDMAVLEVADTGPGIEERHVPYLFDRLYRVGQGRSRADGGAGLGLAIVAAIVHAHGGRVTLDTGPGKGARFRVFLPASEAAPSRL
ncbi:sensor histidine kinase [Nonomuraea sp. NPDC050790]|uniref:sensor histidine kinase n=1 Tax=Nonomuraea sp. NPDC050790 TaxID=3364371 RepID=UPI003787E972